MGYQANDQMEHSSAVPEVRKPYTLISATVTTPLRSENTGTTTPRKVERGTQPIPILFLILNAT